MPSWPEPSPSWSSEPSRAVSAVRVPALKGGTRAWPARTLGRRLRRRSTARRRSDASRGGDRGPHHHVPAHAQHCPDLAILGYDQGGYLIVARAEPEGRAVARAEVFDRATQ